MLDKERHLRFGMGAMIRVEEELNIKFGNIDFNNMSIKELATVIWACMAHEDEGLTIIEVVNLIDEHSDLESVIKVLGKLNNESFDKEKKPEAVEANGIGKKP